jgi:hypothetical protein
MNIKNNYKKKVLIVLDRYKKGGMETHTNLLRKEFNADVCYNYENKIENIKENKIENKIENTIKEEKIMKYSVDLLSNYDIIIWQNTFIEIESSQKKESQKFFYVVHCQCDWWNRSAINLIKKNNDFIDKYIFVSDSVKNKFEKLIFAVDNGIIIENQIESIKNNKDEIKGLFISSGSYHKMKNHHQLIKEFSKLNKSANKLEIYGDISDKTCYDNLQKYIDDNLLTNIKLFEYNDNDIYIERLKEAEYFILFSTSEGCSYSILEAMALNKKIICSEECVTCDQIRNYSKKNVVNKNNYEIIFSNYDNTKNTQEFLFLKKYGEIIFNENFQK